MFLLDTDTYTHLLFQHPAVVSHVAEAEAHGQEVGITVITKAEVLRGRIEALLKADGRERFLAMQRQLSLTEEALDGILIVPLDEVALTHFERFAGAKRIGRIGRADLLVASIVLAQNATLVTRNLKHFRLIPHLNHVNWVV